MEGQACRRQCTIGRGVSVRGPVASLTPRAGKCAPIRRASEAKVLCMLDVSMSFPFFLMQGRGAEVMNFCSRGGGARPGGLFDATGLSTTTSQLPHRF